MAEKKTAASPLDVLGGGLFAASSFVLVLVAMHAWRGPGQGATAVLASWVVTAGGHAAPLLFTAGLAALGARAFLSRETGGLGRHAAGLAGVSAGAAILLGGAVSGAGGALGDALGGALGVLVGTAVVAASAWFAWLAEAFGALRVASSARRLSALGAGAGVTKAEAALLVPDPPLESAPGAAPEIRAPSPPLRNPYPEDVRLKGEVPQGARPLYSDATSSRYAAVAAPPRGQPTEGVEPTDVGAGSDLAAAGRAGAPGGAVRPLSGGARALEARGAPPVPSWEQPALFDEAAPAPPEEAALEEPPESEEEDLDEPERAEAEELETDEDDDLDEELELDEEDEDEDELDTDDDEDEEDDEEDDDDVLASAGASEVVLSPRPAPDGGRKRVASPPAPPAAPTDRLHEAGTLLLNEGRVAVSLLQRSMGLEFDEACSLLDQLQEAGLIGPYLGGQRRDILLSLEEWNARVASS